MLGRSRWELVVQARRRVGEGKGRINDPSIHMSKATIAVFLRDLSEAELRRFGRSRFCDNRCEALTR